MTTAPLHRLALGVETLDAVTGRVTGTALRVGRERPRRPGRQRSGGRRPLDPLLQRADAPLESNGSGRHLLLHDLRRASAGPAGESAVVRIDDPWRRYVPRRLTVPLWTLAEVEAAEAAGRHIPVRSRLLRPWLWPGSAYLLPSGATGLRGVVHAADGALPWARVEARLDANGALVGRAHGDERGEFLLVATYLGVRDLNTASPRIAVRISVFGPGSAPEPADPEQDPLAGLSVEQVPRTPDRPPPLDAALDTPLMRGESLPQGYRQSTAGSVLVRLPPGRVLSEPVPFPFSP
ncbi:hypothetical protein [Streptomyces sp. NPDC087859]|uniref:hypothetical protein n=1 Tax=Streptomyces sp. NPDC087859 TaxID=3365812 RepID=UPI003821EA43